MRNILFTVLFSFSLLFAPSVYLFAETLPFEEMGVGEATKYERPIDAEKRAIEDALSNAMRKGKVAVYYGFQDIYNVSEKRNNEWISSYLNIWSQGVANYEIVEKSYEISDRGQVKCSLKLRGKVSFRGDQDPRYEIRFDLKGKKLGLNKPAYYEGDEVEISFWVTRDAYIHLLAIDEEQNVTLLYPNKFVKSNFLKAGEIFDFPHSLPESKKLALKTYLPKGKKETVELVHIIATKKEPLFIPQETQTQEAQQYEIYSLGKLSDISKRMGKLKRSEWTMQVLPYRIHKK